MPWICFWRQNYSNHGYGQKCVKESNSVYQASFHFRFGGLKLVPADNDSCNVIIVLEHNRMIGMKPLERLYCDRYLTKESFLDA